MDQNVTKASLLFKQASDYGHVGASSQLGHMLIMEVYRKMHPGLHTTRTDDWMRLAGYSSYASFLSGRMENMQRSNLDSNFEMSLNETCQYALKLARYSHHRADAMGTFVLGFANLLGIGMEYNITRALELLQSAAGRNNAEANFIMGEFLMGYKVPGFNYGGEGTASAYPATSGRGINSSPSSSRSNDAVGGQQWKEQRKDGKGSVYSDRAASGVSRTGSKTKEKQIESATASQFYAAAAQRGHTLALHRLAHITSKGLGVVQSCMTAVSGFKSVAERGDWSRKFTVARRLFENLRPAGLDSFSTFHALHTPEALSMKMLQKGEIKYSAAKPSPYDFISLFYETFMSVLGGDNQKYKNRSNGRLMLRKDRNRRVQQKTALTHYAQLASMGYEAAQANAAYILFSAFCPKWLDYTNLNISQYSLHSRVHAISASQEKVDSLNSLSLYLPEESAWSDIYSDNGLSCDARALLFYGLSAFQGNPNAYLRVGDFHYYGKAGIAQDKASAVKYYQLAANQRYSHAIFNLGLMYEVGDGVVQVIVGHYSHLHNSISIHKSPL